MFSIAPCEFDLCPFNVLLFGDWLDDAERLVVVEKSVLRTRGVLVVLAPICGPHVRKALFIGVATCPVFAASGLFSDPSKAYFVV
jgi:hypothetical protein